MTSLAPWVGYLITFLLSVISILLSVLVWLFKKLSDRIDGKVDNARCLERMAACGSCKAIPKLEIEDAELWKAFNTHSHSGLSSDSRVVR